MPVQHQNGLQTTTKSAPTASGWLLTGFGQRTLGPSLDGSDSHATARSSDSRWSDPRTASAVPRRLLSLSLQAAPHACPQFSDGQSRLQNGRPNGHPWTSPRHHAQAATTLDGPGTAQDVVRRHPSVSETSLGRLPRPPVPVQAVASVPVSVASGEDLGPQVPGLRASELSSARPFFLGTKTTINKPPDN